MKKQKPYRVIIRCEKMTTMKLVVEQLVKKFEGNDELRISRIHRG